MSAEGAALCYRTLCVEGAELFGRHGHPEVTLHTYSLADYMRHIDAGDWPAVGELLLSSVVMCLLTTFDAFAARAELLRVRRLLGPHFRLADT